MVNKINPVNRLYRLLSQVNQTIVRVRDHQQLFDEICRIAVEDGGFRLVWIGLIDQEEKIIRPVSWAGYEDGYVQNIFVSTQNIPEGRGPAGITVATGNYVVSVDIERDPRMLPWKDAALKRGYRSLADFPLVTNGKIIGVILFYSSEVNYFDQEEIQLLQGLSKDISFALEVMEKEKQKQNALNLLQQEKKFNEQLIQASPAFFVAMDSNVKILMMNPCMLNALGYNLEEVLGKDYLTLIIPETERSKVKEIFNTLVSSRESTLNENQVLTKEGRILLVEWHGRSIVDEQGNTLYFFGVGIDITERKKSEERIKYLSYHDSLTGLYNRAYLEEEMHRLDTPRQLPLSIIMGDINGLKLVNDAFGHKQGDELLIHIAKILKESCRQEDIVARWGGDEFLILFPKTTNKSVLQVIQRIQNLCKTAENTTIPISLALGLATKETPDISLEVIISQAEENMYRQKLNESRSIRHALITFLEESLQETTQETKEHSKRLQEMAQQMGQVLHLSFHQLIELDLLARLHDLGKIAIPQNILNKPGPLSPEEWEKVKQHPEIGYRIAQSSPDLISIGESILVHHERWDGLGYPRGIKGEEIPLNARIITIIDAYDVMVNGRPYKNPMTPEEALNELQKNAGTQFDPNLVKLFLQIIKGDQKDLG
jgi:diguanylate cyclase (GGDEF)-like protein/PAS domain S-box-containing protein